jgi:hypothetical protein
VTTIPVVQFKYVKIASKMAQFVHVQKKIGGFNGG